MVELRRMPCQLKAGDADLSLFIAFAVVLFLFVLLLSVLSCIDHSKNANYVFHRALCQRQTFLVEKY